MNRGTIKSALASITTSDILDQLKNSLAATGYRSECTLKLSGTVDDFFSRVSTTDPKHQDHTGISQTR